MITIFQEVEKRASRSLKTNIERYYFNRFSDEYSRYVLDTHKGGNRALCFRVWLDVVKDIQLFF